MYYRYLFFVVIAFGLLVVCQSCNDKWLDAKPDKSLMVPKTIKDYQALLDNSSQIFNVTQSSGLAEISSGDFYISNASWASLFTKQEKSAYIWGPNENFYEGESSADWENGYKRILNANLILEGIEKIKPMETDRQAWNNVKGSALFFRSFDFFNLAQEYCKAYGAFSAKTDLGLPLRIGYNVNIQVRRSSLQETYDQIVKDLKSAGQLLDITPPDITPPYKTRPSKQAVFALFARIYLNMENYDQAGLYADSALQIQSELMDYATLNTNAAYPAMLFNREVIFHSSFSYGIFSASRLIVEPALFAAYAANDYRRSVFFKAVASGGVTFKGNYSGDKSLFGGLATDELYLIRAECKARKGEISAALADLNYLLLKRWKGSYQDIVSQSQETVLSIVLQERRKELAFRGLRRLNKDSRFAATITRTLNGQVYKLLPGDKRYVLPIDEQEIRLGGIQQNER